ncbi:MAG: 3'-5' exonuclease [Acidimicrobiales bacterium]
MSVERVLACVTRAWKSGGVAKRYLQVPELILGFDTETTGLSVHSERAISYGFCAYRFGFPVWSEHFYVMPDCPISAGAQRIHGLSFQDLEEKRYRETVYNVEAGLARAIKILRDFHDRGACVVGSNIGRFDLEMLRRTSISVLGNGLDNAYFDLSLLQIIDVVEHDLAIEPSRLERPRRGLGYLCQHYGVTPGGHDALGDARAAVEVFFEQVIRNNDGQVSMLLPTERDTFIAGLKIS